MSNERIDYKHFASKFTYGTGQGPVGNWTKAELKILLDEISRMYKREDALVGAIKELCDSEDSTGCSGDLTVVSLNPLLNLYDLTSYLAYR
jgi:hypothetical protein